MQISLFWQALWRLNKKRWTGASQPMVFNLIRKMSNNPLSCEYVQSHKLPISGQSQLRTASFQKNRWDSLVCRFCLLFVIENTFSLEWYLLANTLLFSEGLIGHFWMNEHTYITFEYKIQKVNKKQRQMRRITFYGENRLKMNYD